MSARFLGERHTLVCAVRWWHANTTERGSCGWHKRNLNRDIGQNDRCGKEETSHRYASGSLKQPNAAQRHKSAQELIDAEKAIVLAQPHRRGDKNQLRKPVGAPRAQAQALARDL
jgi:hypothetical protein